MGEESAFAGAKPLPPDRKLHDLHVKKLETYMKDSGSFWLGLGFEGHVHVLLRLGLFPVWWGMMRERERERDRERESKRERREREREQKREKRERERERKRERESEREREREFPSEYSRPQKTKNTAARSAWKGGGGLRERVPIGVSSNHPKRMPMGVRCRVDKFRVGL